MIDVMTLGPLESRPLDPVWVVSVCMCVARAAPSDAGSRVPRLSARTRVCLPQSVLPGATRSYHIDASTSQVLQGCPSSA